MTAFVATVDAGGLSAAARKLARSPASITRAVAFLEKLTGAELLRRTTRSVRLTEAGDRYLAACRRILGELAEADALAAGEGAAPRGVLAVTSPVVLGRLHVRSIADGFLGANPDVQVRLLLLDRVVNLVEEGVDVAIRVAHMPDSSLLATRVGEVRRVAVASPSYLATAPPLDSPLDLTAHSCISFSQVTAVDSWRFLGRGGGLRSVRVRPRLVTNTADSAIGSALDGRGVTCVLSYQVRREIETGHLVRVLAAFEPEARPVHVVRAIASASSAKVRAFTDAAVPALREALSVDATATNRSDRPSAMTTRRPRRARGE